MTLRFEFHGVPVFISLDPKFTNVVGSWVQKSFAIFLSDHPRLQNKTSGVWIRISDRSASFQSSTGLLLGKTKFCRFFQAGRARICRYDRNHHIIFRQDRQRRISIINGTDTNLMIEMLWMFLLSSVGEYLDRRGLHRLHAFGFHYRSMTFLMPRESKGGKSSLAYLFAKQGSSEVRILGEEIILTDGEQLFQFNTPVSLRQEFADSLPQQPDFDFVFEKKLFPKKYLLLLTADRIQQSPVKIDETCHLLLLKTGVLSRIRFLLSMGLGLGQMQFIEFMLRPDCVGFLFQTFFRRLYAAKRLLQNASYERFTADNPYDAYTKLQDRLILSRGDT